MAAIVFTKVRATKHRLVYSYSGTAAGTLPYATMLADALPGSPLKSALAKLAGECNSDAKAVSALITGESFAGALTPAGVESNIMTRTEHNVSTTAKGPCDLSAVDSGADNNPDLVLTPDADTSGWVFIEFLHSSVR